MASDRNGYSRAAQAKEEQMRVAMMIVAAGCALVALLFAKAPGDGNWEGAIMATFFAGMAGALVAAAGG
jgi:hypothetical protein